MGTGRWLRVGGCVVLIGTACLAQQPEVSVYDTGGTPAEVLSGEALAKKEGWTKLADGKKVSVKGAAVLVNPKMAVVLRAKSNGADIYGTGADGSKLRAHLVPLGDDTGMTLTSLSASPAADGASVEAVYKSGKGTSLAVTYKLDQANPIVKTQPGAGIVGQRMEAPARLGVLPDFFADDMVVDARAIPIDKTEVPGENFFMNMVDNGNAIVAAIWDKNKKDVELSLTGEKDARVISGVDVFYGAGGAIWIGVLEQKGIWAQAEITKENINKATALNWKCPFRAKWKGDFMRVDHTIDSWHFTTAETGWSALVETYGQPCRFDPNDLTKATIQPATKFPNANFEGPFVAYPIERDKDTPLQQLAITDLMKNSLGIGPCETMLDVAAQKSHSEGLFTCGMNAMAVAIFRSGRQKEERKFLERALRDTQVFVKAIADRINSYVAFREETLKYLAEQKTAQPDLAAFIDRLEAQTKKIPDKKVDNNAEVAKRVADVMNEAVSDNPRRDIEKLTAEGAAENSIASIGGGQDAIVARCRNPVKMLRQMATIEMAVNPRSAEVCKEMRKRTLQAMRKPLDHEM